MVGAGINLSGKAAEPVANVFTALAQVVFTMIDLVMKLAPPGIFALIAVTVGSLIWVLFSFKQSIYP